MMIKRINEEYVEKIYEHQSEIYPAAMREGIETFSRLLKAGMSWGAFSQSDRKPGEIEYPLVGWVLFEPELSRHEVSDGKKIAYCYDMAVLPSHRARGLAKQLWKVACEHLRFEDYWIRAHCREQSYGIIGVPELNWILVLDNFIENHYAKEYESDSLIGEHAREVILRPITLLCRVVGQE